MIIIPLEYAYMLVVVACVASRLYDKAQRLKELNYCKLTREPVCMTSPTDRDEHTVRIEIDGQLELTGYVLQDNKMINLAVSIAGIAVAAVCNE